MKNGKQEQVKVSQNQSFQRDRHILEGHISYLANAITAGIETRLTREYISEILRLIQTNSLEQALEKAQTLV